jgi:uncharacterized membrane protein
MENDTILHNTEGDNGEMAFYKLIIVYASSLFLFLVVDFIWLGWVAQSFYHRHLGELLSQRVNWPAAIAFYLIFIVGLMIFCIVPALNRASLIRALVLGGLFGFFTYATYELTNYALIRKWPGALVPVDIAWGVALCAIVSAGGYLVGSWLET